MRIDRKGAVLGAVLSALGSACASSHVLTPAKIEAVHQACDDARAHGSARASVARDRIGDRATRSPPGTPVVVYGAAWCEACKIAASYMTERGIPFVERDAEEDEVAKADRVAVLTSAGLPPSNALPILDVRGTVMVGFLACVLEEAWAAP